MKKNLALLIVILSALASGCAHRDGVKELILAADADDAAMIRRLVGAGVDINGSAFDGWSAITSAAWKGKDQAVLALLESGVEPNFVDENGNTPLFYAGLGCHESTWDLLRSRQASSLGSVQKVEYLVRESAKVCSKTLVAKISGVTS